MQNVFELLEKNLHSVDLGIARAESDVKDYEAGLINLRDDLANRRRKRQDVIQALNILYAVNGSAKSANPRKDPYAEAQAAGQVSREGGTYAVNSKPEKVQYSNFLRDVNEFGLPLAKGLRAAEAVSADCERVVDETALDRAIERRSGPAPGSILDPYRNA